MTSGKNTVFLLHYTMFKRYSKGIRGRLYDEAKKCVGCKCRKKFIAVANFGKLAVIPVYGSRVAVLFYLGILADIRFADCIQKLLADEGHMGESLGWLFAL